MGLLTLEIVIAVISFLIKWIFLTLVFYGAGRLVSGVNAKFTDALLVALIGSIVSEILHWGLNYALGLFAIPLPDPLPWLIAGVASALITLIVYIPLFMHFFDTGLGGALLIGLLCVIFYIIIAFVTGFLIVALAFLIIFGP